MLRRSTPQPWFSCRRYRDPADVPYFELCHAALLAQAAPNSPAGHVSLRALHRTLSPWRDEQSHQALIGIYRLGRAAAAPVADLMIDVERLGSCESYRSAVSAQIGAETGLPVDFSDAFTPRHDAAEVGVEFAAVEADNRARLAAFGAALQSAALLEAPRALRAHPVGTVGAHCMRPTALVRHGSAGGDSV